ncbi:MerR family transcriptional regulator [Amycolatopsis cihanbeyliensis]|uniref:MerR-like DNA binding protein n=1 Tax=Amycolatopsis cihanbeyliensis TaxID=1128664 RepID=A0A542DJC0_AMYCI|nr:MerR family transcriptional regulator [Amycolatopsis cihanbeyliensis]TQJ03104.1 MerR-like DNA binding protein [Amycolatopsis cihanbeyliensis]
MVAAEPTLPVASVARRLGVAPSTLRTWDRRYGVGPSKHTGGRHRRYGAADVNRLELMQRALLSGASTAEAARYALEHLPKSEPGAQAAAPEVSVRIEATNGCVVLPAESPGGTIGPARLARRLSAAALSMDTHAVQRLLDEAVAEYGAVRAWTEVMDPVRAALNGSWRSDGAGAEAEHLLAEGSLAALLRATPVPTEPPNQRPVLLSSVPEDRDALPLYALGAGLAAWRLLTQSFAGPLSADVLTIAVRRSLPAAVVLWARHREAADPRLFARLTRGRQRSRLFACGPGWDPVTLPARVELLGELPAAAERIRYVLLGGGAATP